jgi:hypothetical protein
LSARHPETEGAEVMGHGADVITELTGAHREMEALLARIESQHDPARAKELVDEATTRLVCHSVAEQQYLYPAVRENVPCGEALADREFVGHCAVEQALKELETIDGCDERFPRLVGALIAEVRALVQEEERRLFPALQAAVTWDVLEDLGAKVRHAKLAGPCRYW